MDDVDDVDVDFYIGNLAQQAADDLAQLDLDGDGDVTIVDHNLHVTTLVVTSNGVTGLCWEMSTLMEWSTFYPMDLPWWEILARVPQVALKVILTQTEWSTFLVTHSF